MTKARRSQTRNPYRFHRAPLAGLLWLFITSAALAGEVSFPLRPALPDHHLEDSLGRPFLLTGDSAWSLIADLSLDDAKHYLGVRKRQGFNTVLVSLIEHEFARRAPANAYGHLPFVGASFENPNEAYFQHAEAVIETAASLDMLVLLCPAYLGAGGGPEGWYADMVAAGPEKLRAYGQYLGRRFARFQNIIWVQGGDYDPPDKVLVDAVAEGIAESSPGVLQTVHGDRDSVTARFWEHSKWLAIDTVYTYGDVASAVLARYRSGPPRPFFFIEGLYEGEHGADDGVARLIAYSALLSGAGGQIYGNNPTWHFAAPGLFPASEGWRDALFSRGAQSIGVLAKLFATVEWWKLVPDQRLLEASGAEGERHGLAARAEDGTFAVIYVRKGGRISLDPSSLAPGRKRLRWYDPANGALRMEAVISDEEGLHQVTLPAQANGMGSRDWLGILSLDR